MRTIHKTTNTEVRVLDLPDPKAGGACHQYEVLSQDGTVLCTVNFQHGPVKESGVNGVQAVDLLAILLHRMDCFQSGPFSSPTNEVTAGFLAAAIASEGTRERRVAAVEGTSPVIGVEIVAAKVRAGDSLMGNGGDLVIDGQGGVKLIGGSYRGGDAGIVASDE